MKRTAEDDRVVLLTGSDIPCARLEIAAGPIGGHSGPTRVDLSPQGALDLAFHLIDAVRRGGKDLEVDVRRRRPS